MRNSAIEWCDHTVNFWWGCTKVSPGCAHCYAEMLAKIFSRGKAVWGPAGARWDRSDAAVMECAKLNASALRRGVREKVFVNSMSDTFEAHDGLNMARIALAAAVTAYTQLDFLLLTKRPENVRDMVPLIWLQEWPANVWLGTTAEDQASLNARWKHMMLIPAPVLFLSCEPLLGSLNLRRVEVKSPGAGGTCFLNIASGTGCSLGGTWPTRKVDWVICGGESGHHARAMHPNWATSLRDQCGAAGVPFFFKQWGEWWPFTSLAECTQPGWGERKDLSICWESGVRGSAIMSDSADAWSRGCRGFQRLGKKAAGRCLDGVEHNAFPEVTHV